MYKPIQTRRKRIAKKHNTSARHIMIQEQEERGYSI